MNTERKLNFNKNNFSTINSLKAVLVCKEDIINLKTCINHLIKNMDNTYEPLEIFTMNSIIDQFENINDVDDEFIGDKWRWKMKYCKLSKIPSDEKWAWDNAEEAYRLNLHKFIKKQRITKIEEMQQEEKDNGFKPNKFYWHEALDRSSLACDFFNDNVAEHPAVKNDPELKNASKKIVEMMADFYQQIGHESTKFKEKTMWIDYHDFKKLSDLNKKFCEFKKEDIISIETIKWQDNSECFRVWFFIRK